MCLLLQLNNAAPDEAALRNFTIIYTTANRFVLSLRLVVTLILFSIESPIPWISQTISVELLAETLIASKLSSTEFVIEIMSSDIFIVTIVLLVDIKEVFKISTRPYH